MHLHQKMRETASLCYDEFSKSDSSFIPVLLSVPGLKHKSENSAPPETFEKRGNPQKDLYFSQNFPGKEYFMKRLIRLVLASTLCFPASACSKPLLSPDDPVTLVMWHVYGEQAGSPMDQLIEEFNETEGMEKGIIISTARLSNAYSIGQELSEALSDKPGAPDMPDLFTCHINDAKNIGMDNLLDWNDWFSETEQEEFIPGFLEDGRIGSQLAVLPLSKSTHVLMVNGSGFARFQQDTGISLQSLETWDGFFEAADAYRQWSDGTPFCAFDYLLRAIELYAEEQGAENLYSDSEWYDPGNEILHEAVLRFAKEIARGTIVISDRYSNTQIMTGEVLCGVGSSAAILYYNDTVTYPDGTSEPMDLQVVPFMHAETGKPLMTIAGVGLCARKTTEQKAEAASVFAHWLLDPDRNLSFVTSAGYMPVKKSSAEAIQKVQFSDAGYGNLYEALGQMTQTYQACSEPSFKDYYSKAEQFYNAVRNLQQSVSEETDPDQFAEQVWNILITIR